MASIIQNIINLFHRNPLRRQLNGPTTANETGRNSTMISDPTTLPAPFSSPLFLQRKAPTPPPSKDESQPPLKPQTQASFHQCQIAARNARTKFRQVQRLNHQMEVNRQQHSERLVLKQALNQELALLDEAAGERAFDIDRAISESEEVAALLQRQQDLTEEEEQYLDKLVKDENRRERLLLVELHRVHGYQPRVTRSWAELEQMLDAEFAGDVQQLCAVWSALDQGHRPRRGGVNGGSILGPNFVHANSRQFSEKVHDGREPFRIGSEVRKRMLENFLSNANEDKEEGRKALMMDRERAIRRECRKASLEDFRKSVSKYEKLAKLVDAVGGKEKVVMQELPASDKMRRLVLLLDKRRARSMRMPGMKRLPNKGDHGYQKSLRKQWECTRRGWAERELGRRWEDPGPKSGALMPTSRLVTLAGPATQPGLPTTQHPSVVAKNDAERPSKRHRLGPGPLDHLQQRSRRHYVPPPEQAFSLTAALPFLYECQVHAAAARQTDFARGSLGKRKREPGTPDSCARQLKRHKSTHQRIPSP